MPKPDDVHERPYHHGDLRRAVVVAALEILSETQSLDFSLRELARRAGVSHNAPYKHFKRNGRKISGAILACWSLVHGLTLLLADGLVGPRKKSAELGESLVQGMLDGLAAKLPTLPAGSWVGPQGH